MSGKALLAKLLGTTTPPVSVAASGAVEGSDQVINLEQLADGAFAEGHTAGAKAERERFGAVLTTDLGAKHSGLAITLLSTTDLSADLIATQLGAADKASPAAAAPAPAAPAAPAAPQVAAVDPIAGATPIVPVGAAPAAAEEKETVAKGWASALAQSANELTRGGLPVAGYRPN